MKEKTADKNKLHQRYFLKNGQEVPGGSTIAGMLDKGFGMVGSAVKLTKAGYNYCEVWQEKREIGTVVHKRILFDLKGIEPKLDEYSKLIINKSDYCMKSYFKWKSEHILNPIYCEKEYVSEEMKVGGTMDLIGDIDSELSLTDYKSGGLWDESFYQIAGYGLILEENGIRVKKLRLLNIPRAEDDKFDDRILTDKERNIYGEIFKELCKIYWKRSELKYGL